MIDAGSTSSIALLTREVEKWDGEALHSQSALVSTPQGEVEELWDREGAETMPATVLDSPSQWLADDLKTTVHLASLGQSWEVSGADPPNKTALDLTRTVLRALARIDLRPHRIAPSTDEGVCISFESGERYADIECFNTGELFAVTHTSKAQPYIWPVNERGIIDAVATINSYIQG